MSAHDEYIEKLRNIDDSEYYLRDESIPFPKYTRVKIPLGTGLYNMVNNILRSMTP